MRKLIARFEQPRGHAPSASPRRSSRGSSATATWSSPRPTSAFGHWVQRKFSPPYELAMRVHEPRARPGRPLARAGSAAYDGRWEA